jgi:hypothetical protein
LHRIDPPNAALARAGSSLDRSLGWIERLYESGRRAGKRFVARHIDDLGVRDTLIAPWPDVTLPDRVVAKRPA